MGLHSHPGRSWWNPDNHRAIRDACTFESSSHHDDPGTYDAIEEEPLDLAPCMGRCLVDRRCGGRHSQWRETGKRKCCSDQLEFLQQKLISHLKMILIVIRRILR